MASWTATLASWANKVLSVARLNAYLGAGGNLDYLLARSNRLIALAGTAKTIASDAITVAPAANGEGHYTVDTEGAAATDNLSTISGGAAGDILSLQMANAGHVVTIKHGVGNIKMPRNLDLIMSATFAVQLRYDGSNWYLLGGTPGGENMLIAYNNSGVTLNQGDVVCLDKSYTSGLGVCLASVVAARQTIGVVYSASIAAGGLGYIAVGNIQWINVGTGAVVFGHSLVAAAAGRYAQDSGRGSAVANMIGWALGASAGGYATQIQALITGNPDVFSTAVPVVEGTLQGSGSLQCGSNLNRMVIAVCIGYNSASNQVNVNAVPTVGGSTMTQIGLSQPITKLTIAVYALAGNGTGLQTTVEATWTGGTNVGGFTYFIALSGAAQSSYYTAIQTGTATSNAPAITDTVVSIPDLVIGILGKVDTNDDATSVLTGCGPYWSQQTKVHASVGASGYYGLFEFDTIGASTTSMTDTWTASVSRTWYMAAISIHSM
jgi:hypothetical protein